MPADRLVLVALKEALSRRRLLELANQRQPGQLAVLVRQPQHPAEHGELAIDRRVRCALLLALDGVARRLRGPDRGEPVVLKESVDVAEAVAGLDHVAVA